MYLCLTVDVEAAPGRQRAQHAERLIWGRFGNALPETGIGALMDIAERHGVPMSFFVDFCECTLWPGAMEEAGREIVRRGFDLELHAHHQHLPASFWADCGLPPPPECLSGFQEPHARALLRFLCEKAKECGATPHAFRGGGFDFSSDIVRCMPEFGLNVSCNLTRARLRHLAKPWMTSDAFLWENGVCEACMPLISVDGKNLYFAFEQLPWDDLSGILAGIDELECKLPHDAVLVMVMHSFAGLVLDEDKRYFEHPGEDRLRHLSTFLSAVASRLKVISVRELARLARVGAVARETRSLVWLDALPRYGSLSKEEIRTQGTCSAEALSALAHAVPAEWERFSVQPIWSADDLSSFTERAKKLCLHDAANPLAWELLARAQALHSDPREAHLAAFHAKCAAQIYRLEREKAAAFIIHILKNPRDKYAIDLVAASPRSGVPSVEQPQTCASSLSSSLLSLRTVFAFLRQRAYRLWRRLRKRVRQLLGCLISRRSV